MKNYNKIILLIFFFIGMSLQAQITFNACHSIIENQNYTFNLKSTDVTGRNVFETDPVTGDQDCGGIGVCEMQIAWNVAESRWEILADDGNGTFSNTYVLYYNTEASIPNPPSTLLGTWVENTSVTTNLCADGITTLSGDVQDTTLGSSEDVMADRLLIYPNPTSSTLNVRMFGVAIDRLSISDINGRVVMSHFIDLESINISALSAGMYFLKIEVDDFQITKKVIVK